MNNFLAEFRRSEGSKGGEFFTPRSVVRLMVDDDRAPRRPGV